jgi:hypothetical protein
MLEPVSGYGNVSMKSSPEQSCHLRPTGGTGCYLAVSGRYGRDARDLPDVLTGLPFLPHANASQSKQYVSILVEVCAGWTAE